MGERIRAVIVDDEELARTGLKLLLQEFPEITIVGECSNGFEAFSTIKELTPEVIFLDIQMPKLTGFDLLELLGPEAPYIIFITAYDEYAVKAFEAHAVDYLLKPVKKERLLKAIERLETYLPLKQKPVYEKLLGMETIRPKNRILVKDKNKIHIIPVDQITYIEAQVDYVVVHTEKDQWIKHERMSNIEQNLDTQTFLRVHRSYIVNVTFIERIEPYTKDSKIALLKNGLSIPISKAGYAQLMNLIR